MILNTPDVFKTVLPGNKIMYDVTGLTPDTMSDTGKVRKRSTGKSTVVPLQQHETDEEEVEDKSHLSLAELLIELDSSVELVHAAAVLDTSPMKNLSGFYWSAYQWLFTVIFFCHIAYMILYSYFSVLMQTASWTIYSCNQPTPLYWTNGSNITWSAERPPINPHWLLLSEPTITLIFFLFEMFMIIKRSIQRGCGFNVENVNSDLLGHVLLRGNGVAFSVLTITWFALYHNCSAWQDYFLSVSLICGWIYSFHFTRGFKGFHHFVIMLQHMLFRDVSKFALIYSFILMAFAFAFYALIQAIPVMQMNAWDTLFTVFNWMIGMADFETDPTSINELAKSEPMIRVVYCIYIIMSTIVLLNLLIAMMSDSYSEVKEKSSVTWKVGSLKLAIETERLFPFLSNGFGCLKQYGSRLQYDESSHRWLLVVPITQVWGRHQPSDDAINDLNLKLNMVSDNVDQITASLEILTKDITELKNANPKPLEIKI